ncbi:MAG: zf-HC2 domain-containing protein [Proteobacteria bacterium]|nr:zf-HC2 domain-containing protein [Pseudomonadota bacterium]
MSCTELERFLDAYLDGELDEAARAPLAAHLQDCEPCRAEAAFGQRLRQRVREAAATDPAPERLRRQIRELVAQGAPHTAPRVGTQGASRPWWGLALAAAAGLALVVLPRLRPLTEAGAGTERGAVTMAALAEQSVQWHRSRAPLDVRGASSESIRDFFSDKVPFAVRLPRFHAQQAQLEGARLSSLGGQQAAYLSYRIGGDHVSVFVVDPSVVAALSRRDPSADPTRQPTLDPNGAGRVRVRWRGVRGYNFVLYARGDADYVITSEMDRSRLVRLIGQ